MYMGDHIVISIGVAAIASRVLKLPFLHVAVLFMLANLIDLDHLINYHLDDGTANSMLLHPLHMYSTYIISTFLLIGLIRPKARSLCWLFSAAISLHIFLDAVSAMMHYEIPSLLMTSLVTTCLSCFAVYRCLNNKKLAKQVIIFMLGSLVICNLELVIAVYALKIVPQSSFCFWLVPPFLSLILTVIFWKLFCHRNIDTSCR